MTVKHNSNLRDSLNSIATHPLQSFEWGEFREKTGIKVIRRGFEKNGKLIEGFQVTIHPIPHTPFFAGYLPKGTMPTEEMLQELKKIGREEQCIFIQLEPNVKKSSIYPSPLRGEGQGEGRLVPAAHPLFTKYTMILDLTKSEEELLKNMHPKTRYNIKVAQKHGVAVHADDSDKAFEKYLELTRETTGRQGFYAHTEKYHRLMWETLRMDNVIATSPKARKQSHTIEDVIRDRRVVSAKGGAPRDDNNNQLTAHLLTATYQNKILVAWIIFVFHDTLYYPYGASSNEHREVMASTAMMWETIRWGKKLGLKKFDMWGALGPDANPKDPWFGFHRFKQGFGPELVEFVGSYDLIISPMLYQAYKVVDKLRWMYLKLRK
ncbi:MAG: peptidoglycan bridge formation glycyltransferase FemA/FemB family protein [Candidatus Levybacteria bacterium]|nr:peptidoglycan bridge formation glycyltransferase FemA/FemB family protein [Candidatus Levybacteria bacterium]